MLEATAHKAVTTVEVGTALSNRKGVSVPDSTIDFAALTPKDRADLDAGLAVNADWIALSFIQRPEDLIEVRAIVKGRAGVLAKIEKPQAVEHLGAIIEQAERADGRPRRPRRRDALERVPGIQKQITRAARRAGKPVVVATQMLESMITAPTPTRAEVSDVATAVFEGADAIMLSAESASGAYPVEAVSTMDRIAREVERDPYYVQILRAQRTDPEATGADAISAAARQIAETLNLAAICCYTSSGTTAVRAARERPQTPVIALSPIVATARRLSIVWGLHCVVGEEPADIDGMVERACTLAARTASPSPASASSSPPGCRSAPPAPPTCCAWRWSATTGRRRAEAPASPRNSDVLAALQDVDGLADVVELGIDRVGALEGGERLAAIAVLHHDHAEAGERAEVARVELQRGGDVGQRLVVGADGEIERRPLVPAFDVIRPTGDDGVQRASARPGRPMSICWMALAIS